MGHSNFHHKFDLLMHIGHIPVANYSHPIASNHLYTNSPYHKHLIHIDTKQFHYLMGILMYTIDILDLHYIVLEIILYNQYAGEHDQDFEMVVHRLYETFLCCYYWLYRLLTLFFSTY